MAGLDGVLEIKGLLRPCWVENRKALFHLWAKVVDWEKAPPYMDPVIAVSRPTIRAVVEYEDGTVSYVPPESITFLDTQWQMAEFEACYYREEDQDGCC